MAEEKKGLDIIDIDAPTAEEMAAAEKPVPDSPLAPEHLVVQNCQLPAALMAKDELIRYLGDHGITVAERKEMGEISQKERQLFQLYTQAIRSNARRVTLQHFVAAFRLFNCGHELWPNRQKNLAEMRVD